MPAPRCALVALLVEHLADRVVPMHKPFRYVDADAIGLLVPGLDKLCVATVGVVVDLPRVSNDFAAQPGGEALNGGALDVLLVDEAAPAVDEPDTFNSWILYAKDTPDYSPSF